MGFSQFGLSDRILQGVAAAGHTEPTPIQSLAIIPALSGKDIIARAQTGTGKTAAFVLPILQHITTSTDVRSGDRRPRALVLTPTRELAQQVREAVSLYSKSLHIRAIAIYGGTGMTSQIALLRKGMDIVVATPGRLLDHIGRQTIDLSGVQVLVLDEADRMLDMGFIRDVEKIVRQIPANRQTMLFSATIPPEITELCRNILHSPERIEAGEQQNPAETVVQHFYEVQRDGKMDLLTHVLETEKMESVLVFSRTKHGADKISRRLDRRGIMSIALHSNRSQAQRERALEGFKKGTYRVLVATDIAARGIDVTGISHVVNFDVPTHPEDYIHRIGRTGRAGASGDALTFVSRDEMTHLRSIEKFVGQRHAARMYPGFKPVTRDSRPPEDRGGVHRAPVREHHENKVHQTTSGGTGSGGGWSNSSGFSRRGRTGAQKGKSKGFSANSGGPRKKKPVKMMDAYSTGTGGERWSNH
jgi:ATP-dependent RNA helicase RhlE